MVYLVYLIGVMIAVGGLMLLVRPGWVTGIIERGVDKPAFYVFAVAIRIVLGALLVTQASLSRFPVFMEILGYIVLAAAVALLLMGLKRFSRLINWIMAKVRPLVWVGGLFGLLFGAFLIYAFPT